LDKDTLLPNPDFFNALLFSRLMGPRVLAIETPEGSPTLHAYAHCTSPRTSKYDAAGAVTVLLLNFDPTVSYQVWWWWF